MRTRSIALLIPAALAGSPALAQNPPGLPGGQPPPRGETKAATPSNTMLDGNWTVVAAARGGKSSDGVGKMTVAIQGGMVTVADAGNPPALRAMRLDFGPQGTLRMTEAGADGKFDPAPPVTRVAEPGGPAPVAPRSGVYVLVGDYAAVTVYDAVAPATGTPGTRPVTPPPTTTGSTGGTTSTSGITATGGVGVSGPDAGTPYLSVLLKRSGRP